MDIEKGRVSSSSVSAEKHTDPVQNILRRATSINMLALRQQSLREDLRALVQTQYSPWASLFMNLVFSLYLPFWALQLYFISAGGYSKTTVAIVVISSISLLFTVGLGWFLLYLKVPKGHALHRASTARDALVHLVPTLQSVLVISVSLYFALRLLAQAAQGHCSDAVFDSHFLCGSSDAYRLPIHNVLGTCFGPLVVYFLQRDIAVEAVLTAWFISCLAIGCICVFQPASVGQVAAILVFYMPCSGVVLFDTQRQHLVMYSITHELQSMLKMNERLADETHATELRHMIGNVAHDLKTPLASFLSGVETVAHILRECERRLRRSDAEDGELVGFIQEGIGAMQETIENIKSTNSFMLMTINRCLDYTKASKGMQLVPKMETIDLNEALHLPLKIINDFQSHLQIRFEGLSSSRICSHIITDRQWLIENMLCLLSNAVKYSSRGTVDVTVKLVKFVPLHKPSAASADESQFIDDAVRMKPAVSASFSFKSLSSFRMSGASARSSTAGRRVASYDNSESSWSESSNQHRLDRSVDDASGGGNVEAATGAESANTGAAAATDASIGDKNKSEQSLLGALTSAIVSTTSAWSTRRPSFSLWWSASTKESGAIEPALAPTAAIGHSTAATSAELTLTPHDELAANESSQLNAAAKVATATSKTYDVTHQHRQHNSLPQLLHINDNATHLFAVEEEVSSTTNRVQTFNEETDSSKHPTYSENDSSNNHSNNNSHISTVFEAGVAFNLQADASSDSLKFSASDRADASRELIAANIRKNMREMSDAVQYDDKEFVDIAEEDLLLADLSSKSSSGRKQQQQQQQQLKDERNAKVTDAESFRGRQLDPIRELNATATVSSGAREKKSQHSQSKVSDADLYLKFEVQDTGIGLSEEAMANLFNPFKQAQRLAGGTGLGLFSLAKRLEALGGKYGVRSRADGQQGSVFWFTMPYRPDELSARIFRRKAAKKSQQKAAASAATAAALAAGDTSSSSAAAAAARVAMDTSGGMSHAVTKVDAAASSWMSENSIASHSEDNDASISPGISASGSTGTLADAGNHLKVNARTTAQHSLLAGDSNKGDSKGVSTADDRLGCFMSTTTPPRSPRRQLSPKSNGLHSSANFIRVTALSPRSHFKSLAEEDKCSNVYSSSSASSFSISSSASKGGSGKNDNFRELHLQAIDDVTVTATAPSGALTGIVEEAVSSPSSRDGAPLQLQSSKQRRLSTASIESSVAQFSSLNILLVDDSLPIRKMTSMLLRRRGHKVTQADHGLEALEKAIAGYNNIAETAEVAATTTITDAEVQLHQQQQNGRLSPTAAAIARGDAATAAPASPASLSASAATVAAAVAFTRAPFDVVLMDLQMPVMDGLEATRRLRAAEKAMLQRLQQQQPALAHALTTAAELNSSNAASPQSMKFAAAASAAAGEDFYDSPSNSNADLHRSSSTVQLQTPLSRRGQLQLPQHKPFHQIVIGVSANSDHFTTQEAFKAGVDDFMGKPFSVDQFDEIVKKVVLKLF